MGDKSFLNCLPIYFDALEVKAGETEAAWQKAINAISNAYQPAASDDKPLVMSLRDQQWKQ